MRLKIHKLILNGFNFDEMGFSFSPFDAKDFMYIVCSNTIGNSWEIDSKILLGIKI